MRQLIAALTSQTTHNIKINLRILIS